MVAAAAALCLCSTAAALQRATPPRMSTQHFQAGNYWIWEYRDGAGGISSWERYAVQAAEGSRVVLDMASRFDEAEPFSTHHRMKIDLVKARAAKESHTDWEFDDFLYRDPKDLWAVAPHRDNVQAFEEKFNVVGVNGPVVETRRLALPTFFDGSPSTLVQTRRHSYTNAWYVREPRRHSGLAAYKSFGPEGAADSYSFQLVDVGWSIDHVGTMQEQPADRGTRWMAAVGQTRSQPGSVRSPWMRRAAQALRRRRSRDVQAAV